MLLHLFFEFVGSSNSVGGNKHMVIGDRLRALAEGKKLHKATLKSAPDYSRYISRVETDTQFGCRDP